MFIIDLGVPRNAAPEVDRIGQIYVYDIDILGRIVAEHQQQRLGEMPLCEKILDEEIDAFERWLEESRAGPLIQQMYGDAHDLRDLELARFFQACPDLGDPQREAVRQLTDRLINKMMHPCTQTLRQHGVSQMSATLARTLHAVTVKHRDRGNGEAAKGRR